MNISRRSAWAMLLRVLGSLFLIAGLGLALIFIRPHATPQNFLFAGSVAAAGIQFFFFAFLVDVFTDIRWFLKEMSERERR